MSLGRILSIEAVVDTTLFILSVVFLNSFTAIILWQKGDHFEGNDQSFYLQRFNEAHKKHDELDQKRM